MTETTVTTRMPATTDSPAPASPLRRRGLIAGAAALAATLLAKQANDSPVLAADGGGMIIGANTYTANTTSLTSTAAAATAPVFRAVASNAGTFLDTSIDAVQGYGKGTSNSGLLGRNDDLNAIGTTGVATNGTGSYGQSGSGTAVGGSSSSGAGAYGLSATGIGVQGVSGTPPGTFPAGTGIYASSSIGNGLFANSASGIGAVGITQTGIYGVYGECVAGPGGASGLIGVASGPGVAGFGTVLRGGATVAGQFGGDVFITPIAAIPGHGNLSVAGNAVVGGSFTANGFVRFTLKDKAGLHRSLYGVSSPENLVEDIGTGNVVGGVASVALDPALMEVVDTSVYQVFLTEYDGNHGLYVTNRSASGFEVHTASGSGDASFGWRVLVKQGSDAKVQRLAKYSYPQAPPFEFKIPDFGAAGTTGGGGAAPLPPAKPSGNGGSGPSPSGQGPSPAPTPAPLPVVTNGGGSTGSTGVAPAPIPPRRP